MNEADNFGMMPVATGSEIEKTKDMLRYLLLSDQDIQRTIRNLVKDN